MVDERRTTLIVAPPGSQFGAQLARELERLGHEVVEVSDWQAALVAAAGCPPDVVVFDSRFPATEGSSRQRLLAQLQQRRPSLVVIGLGGTAPADPSGEDP